MNRLEKLEAKIAEKRRCYICRVSFAEVCKRGSFRILGYGTKDERLICKTCDRKLTSDDDK